MIAFNTDYEHNIKSDKFQFIGWILNLITVYKTNLNIYYYFGKAELLLVY